MALGGDLRRGGGGGSRRGRQNAIADLCDGLSKRFGPKETPFAKYIDRPVEFCREILGVEPWGRDDSRTGEQDGQLEVLQALAGNQSVTLKSGRDVGKTFLAACAGLWWNQTRPNSVVMTTAPTGDQVRGLIWREIRNLFAMSREPLLGECLTTELNVSPLWFMMGRSTDRPERFLGWHGRGGLFFIVDEASGVDEKIFAAAKGFSAKGDGAELYIGNPTNPHGTFADSHEPGSRFVKFTINSEDAPEDMISDKWIDECRSDWGPDWAHNPLYLAYVRGEFPREGEDSLISLTILERCAELSFPTENERHMGVDIARMGPDRCVALLMRDMRIVARDTWGKVDLMVSAHRILALAKKWDVPFENVHIDATGMGAGVVDRLAEAKVFVDPVEFNKGPRGDWKTLLGPRVSFDSRRAELYYTARVLLEQEMVSIPARYREVWGELCAVEWIPDKGGGKIGMVKKEKTKKQLGRSPDDADAFICALARPPVRRYGADSIRRRSA